jgi:hypothetical protein
MKNAIAVALIVMGGLIILGPIAAGAYSSNRDKDRVAEFYSHNTNAAVLPNDLHPTGHDTYDYACWLAGVGMVLAGVIRERSASPATTA